MRSCPCRKPRLSHCTRTYGLGPTTQTGQDRRVLRPIEVDNDRLSRLACPGPACAEEPGGSGRGKPCYLPRHSAVLCASSRHLRCAPARPKSAAGPVLRAWRPVWIRLSGSDTATEPLWTSPWLPRRLLPTCLAQLAIDTNRSQIGHDVARFTSIRDSWAAFLPASISVGMRSPVPKYISWGV